MYSGQFYPRPVKFIKASQSVPMSQFTPEQRQRMARQRALAMRKRGIRPFLSSQSSFPEIKAVDLPLLISEFATVGTGNNQIGAVNLIQAGSSFFNRVGRKIELKSFTFKGIVFPVRTQTNEHLARIILLYDRQTNGALPAVADILQTTDQTGANTTTSYSGINMNYRDRFLILRDIKLALPSVTDTGGVTTNLGAIDGVTPTTNISFHVKLKNLVTQYRADSSPSVIGDIATGGLYMLFLGNLIGSLGVATNGWNIAWESRLRYGDS